MVKLIATDEFVATIQAMKCQEESYSRKDYLYNKDSSIKRPDPNFLDEECRFRMIDWCCQVAEFLTIRREIVSVAVRYLDCYLSCSPTEVDRRHFQGIVIACLYTAMEIHTNHHIELSCSFISTITQPKSPPTKLAPAFMARITQGAYTPEQIVKLQLELMNTLQWRLNPPTARTFLQYYLCLVPSILMTSSWEDEERRLLLEEAAQQQMDLAEQDYQFVCCTASSIALASLANAMQHVDCYYCQSNVQYSQYHPVILALSEYANIDIYTPNFVTLQENLRQLLMPGEVRYHGCLNHRHNKQNETIPSSPRGIITTKHAFNSS
mmetsp:Transcript_11283/g.16583  ORF Transcript_11283/g.16583 Transcript_11283/m.16583 type:complete len:323 (+) Transcript_11283:187-1155(+)|eukprot:CAMPEP_0194200246 /NCGR_PEP_ID=MMETSP0156-20130528/936_1 /TAXON_ID=33649 /ORGANISM="Thalassionema nitzschioides, Strain L26-B" /LENGTH=322 /DNA_ID=CAMNT_0038925219 /DNA_START=116 /DNA_END=1081 /DNA_ORIENTATION=-